MDLPRVKLFPILAGVSCILSSIFWFTISFPGILVGDNVSMMAEALPGGSIGDQHSVMFIWLLRLSNEMFGYNIYYPLLWGVIWWHLGIFFYAIGLYEYTQSYWSLSICFVFSLVPFVCFIIPHLPVKDFMMSSMYMAASGFLFYIWLIESKSILLNAAAILSFFPALSMRHNAIFAFIPFAVICSLSLKESIQFNFHSKSNRYLVSTLFFIAITVVLLGGRILFDSGMRDYKNYFAHSSILIFDLAGMSIQSNELKFPPEVLEVDVTFEKLKASYNPAGWDPLWGGWGVKERIIKKDIGKREYQLLMNTWLKEVIDNPKDYLSHRTAHFNKFIYWRNNYIYYSPWPPNEGFRLLFDYTPDYLQEEVVKNYSEKSFEVNHLQALLHLGMINSVLSKKVGKWFYSIAPHYCLTILTLLFSITFSLILILKFKSGQIPLKEKRFIEFICILFLSGLLYFIFYFFVSISSDWRYIHWSLVSMSIGSCLLCGLHVKKIFKFLIDKNQR